MGVIMDGRFLNLVRLLALCGTCASAVYARSESCTTIPEGSTVEDAAVVACETPLSYKIRITDDTFTFSKREFRTRLGAAISQWWLTRHEDLQELARAPITIWMNVPDSNPSAAQARAIVHLRESTLAISFDVRSSNWVVSDGQVAVLGGQEYPQTFGWRPSQLLVQMTPDADKSLLVQDLRVLGVTLSSSSTGRWLEAETALFDEQTARERIDAWDPKHIKVASVEVNSLFEWIAWRSEVFHFTLEIIEQ